MIIDYNKNPSLTSEQKIQSLRDSVQRALDSQEESVSSIEKVISTINKTGVYIKVVELLSDPLTVASGGFERATAYLEEISGYTPNVVSASLSNAGSAYSKCIISYLRVSGNEVLCSVRNIGDSEATDIKVAFRVIYIANIILPLRQSGGGGGGTNDYTALTNKPSIELVELTGNKSFGDLGLNPLDNMDLAEILV